MNLNREQFLDAVEKGEGLYKALKSDYPELKLYPVFCRKGPRSGQLELSVNVEKLAIGFPSMLVESAGIKGAGLVERYRTAVFKLKAAEKDDSRKVDPKLYQSVDQLKQNLLDPERELYCGDVNIELRVGMLKYEVLHHLQQDSRLPAELNEVGSVRVVLGRLDELTKC